MQRPSVPLPTKRISNGPRASEPLFVSGLLRHPPPPFPPSFLLSRWP